MINIKDYTIIVMSCDSYSDIWPYFAKCWDRFWPDCPFDTYLISEEKEFKHERIGNIKIGRKVGWSDMLLEALDRIQSKHIIYMQEDYLLKGETNILKLNEFIDAYEKLDAAYLRLFPWPNADERLEKFPELGMINKTTKYRTSLQCAVWDVSILKQLTLAGESGWDFEAKSVERSSQINRLFLSVNTNLKWVNMNDHHHVIDYFATAVLHGKWMREAIFTFRKIGISIDSGKRGILNRWDYWYRQKSQHPKHVFEKRMLDWLNANFFKRSPIQKILDCLAIKK